MVFNLSIEFLVEKLESLIASVYSEDPDGKRLCLVVNELDVASRDNYGEFMHCMSVILANYEKYSIAARRGAALQLKQRLTNRDTNITEDLRKRWLAVPRELRDSIKMNTLEALQANHGLRTNNSSQVIAYLALTESPLSQNWPDLIPSLCQMIRYNRDEGKEGPVEALAFVCKELGAELLIPYAHDITSAIVTCFAMKRSSDCIRLAALICFLECFDFTKILLASYDNYHLSMSNICRSAKSVSSEICIGGLATLVRIATYDYECLKGYMDEIGTITIEAIKSDHQRTHIQALEFWKAVSHHETPRDSEGKLVYDRGYVFRYGFSERVLEKLVPALLHVLERGEFIQNLPRRNSKIRNCPEELDIRSMRASANNRTREKNRKPSSMQNECRLKSKEKARHGANPTKGLTDNWTPPKEVIIYLSELCESFPKIIDIYILPRFPTKIKHENWRERNAALWSLLVFLQQMKLDHAKEVLPYYLPLVIDVAQDRSNFRIRNTALWVLSWMFDKYPCLVVSYEKTFLKNLISILLTCLNDDEGRVAPTSCITITSLVKASYLLSMDKSQSNLRPCTFHLSEFYDQITDCLVTAAGRRLTAAFEALRQVLIMAPEDCYWIVLDTFDTLLAQLRKVTVLPEIHPVGCDCHETVQQILCAVLRSIFKSLRFGEQSTIQLGWKFVRCIKDILKQFPHGKAREDATLAASSIVTMLGWRVKDHLSWEIPHISPILNPRSDRDKRTYNL